MIFRVNAKQVEGMKKKLACYTNIVLGSLGIFACTLAQATTVSYSVANIAGNAWQYTYTVTNDTLTSDIEEFSIFFDVSLTANLALTSSPAQWSPLVFQPDPGIPDDGLFDALALVSGISHGASQGGFQVQFDFLGSGVPGAQTFAVIDPNTFAQLDTGLTQIVPLPAAIWMFAASLLLLTGIKGAQYNNCDYRQRR